jgi:preprotein translocase subunit SecE
VVWNPVHWVDQSRVFLSDVLIEMRKVTWPTQKETVVGAIAVIVLVAVIGVGLYLVDGGLSGLMSLLWS